MAFALTQDLSPTPDQQRAIGEIVAGLDDGERCLTLLGATGTGKTMTMAASIARLERPALVIAPNKTLAAQLCTELRGLLPQMAVEYFVSYYDYYQPEAYIPGRDLFIDKEAVVNAEIDRLRHAATAALLSRRDSVIVASVSCIYGLGNPDEYRSRALVVAAGDEIVREDLFAALVERGYTRNDTTPARGSFRARGDSIDIIPTSQETALRLSFFDEELEAISLIDPVSGRQLDRDLEQVLITPATHYALPQGRAESVIAAIEEELEERLAQLMRAGHNLEAQRLEQRTRYDIEMLRQTGLCAGIENYSRHLDGRAPGERPWCLLDYFPSDYICVIDESHQTLPQIAGMGRGDLARKRTLVDHGFRLPSAIDNRPQSFDEFLERAPQLLCLSATPGSWERSHSARIVEQIIRPTHILDPEIDVRSSDGQIDDLLPEIRQRAGRSERVLVTTLTKKMAERLTDFLREHDVRVRYLHSDVETLERIALIRDLRQGKYDVLVGVNLLREGLDLPEVSLVAILDADAEGFLRGETALIQTIGRAARHPQGRVIMYARRQSEAMRAAITETERRRQAQADYNQRLGLVPQQIIKDPSALEGLIGQALGQDEETQELVIPETTAELIARIAELEAEMGTAADELRFEDAARARDELAALRALDLD